MPSAATAPDRELPELFRQLALGEQSPLAAAYAQLWPPVQRFCRRFLRDDAAGDDAAQEAILKVFAQVDRYDPRQHPLAWVLTVATWECRSERRRRTRRREVGLAAASPRTEAPVEGAVWLNEVLDLLGPKDRSVVEAALRGESLAAAQRQRKRRALAWLRRVAGGADDA